jgi:hypothetical protein
VYIISVFFWFTPLAGALLCTPGFVAYRMDNGTDTCQGCIAGTYQTGFGMTFLADCERCPSGTYQTGLGMGHFSNCTPCAFYARLASTRLLLAPPLRRFARNARRVRISQHGAGRGPASRVREAITAQRPALRRRLTHASRVQRGHTRVCWARSMPPRASHARRGHTSHGRML